jgi:hypothetical protein
MWSNLTKSVSVFLVLISALFLFSHQVQAATIYVNSNSGNDSTGDGSSGSPYKTFHKGYTVASADDTIDLTGTFTWTDAAESGDNSTSGYTISKNLTIQGQGADSTIVQAHSADDSADRRVFTISSGTTVTINDLQIRYGKLTGSTGYGAGISNSGTLTINKCQIDHNRATGGGGGGINNLGTLTVRDSTVHNNVVYYMGGGLLNHYDNPDGTMDVINTTVAFNEQTATIAYTEGAGVYYRRGSGTVTNSTIAHNTGESTVGLGLGDSESTVHVQNSIIAENTGNNDVGYRSSNNGTLSESGNNIFGKTSYYFTSNENNTWVDDDEDDTYTKNGDSSTGSLYLSSSLADNSTLNGTQTLAITNQNSIAVDNGSETDNDTISIPSTDQRGLNRSGDTDIGAYEYGGSNDSTDPVISSISSSPSETTASLSTSLCK